VNSCASEGQAVPAPLVTNPVISINEKRLGKCVRQEEHIRGHVFRNGLHRVTRMSIKNIVPHTYDEVVGPSVDDMQYYNYEI
jgi:hypothetical protein